MLSDFFGGIEEPTIFAAKDTKIMEKSVLRDIIYEGQELLRSLTLHERPMQWESAGRYVLVGIRQAGKSYLLYQRARQLMAAGHDVREMVLVNFDDERLLGMQAGDLDLILQTYASIRQERPILFFDEIQQVDGWEHFARRLANQKYSVFITGSNARMLSRDIATTLGGRYMEQLVYPYSFAEYLSARGVLSREELAGDSWQYGSKRDALRRLFEEYFRWGGFPELLLFMNKRQWLNALYDKILLGDVIQRNHLRGEQAVRLCIKRLAENLRQPTAYTRLSNMLKSTGLNTSAATVMDYIACAKDACILFTLDNYASKFAEKETIKKHYFTDNGLLNIFLTGGETSLLENLCAIQLRRIYGERLCYYQRNVEVDFYVPEEGLAVQACYSLADIDTLKREITALRKLNAIEPLRRMQIVSYDDERSIPLPDGRAIEVVPAWKWLLQQLP